MAIQFILNFKRMTKKKNNYLFSILFLLAFKWSDQQQQKMGKKASKLIKLKKEIIILSKFSTETTHNVLKL